MTTASGLHRPRLYSARDVRELDRCAIERHGIPGHVLMQRAARAAFSLLRECWPQAARLVVLCGPGNNGGDGYEVACLARAAGLHVDVVAVGATPAKGDAVSAHAAWCAGGGIVRPFGADGVLRELGRAEVLVDAVFGIGIDRPVSGTPEAAIRALNLRLPQQRVLALDLPSGLDSDSGEVHGVAVRADATISFIGRKIGLYLGAGPEQAGARHFADLDIPSAVFGAAPGRADLLRRQDLAQRLPRRRRDAHKGRHGHVLVVGGNAGMAGAALLAARGALRSGAGLVSVATRAAHAPALSAAQPELMVHAVETAEALQPLLARADVVALGPGLGQDDWARTLYRAVLQGAQPTVIDADALNLLAAGVGPGAGPAHVLTPHPGEAARLLGLDSAQVQAQRLQMARQLHDRTGATSVLKGAGSLVAGARGLGLCPYGNPGMGVGGMGDVLSGIIAALIAQGLDLQDAAELGVLAHALAGDAAAAAGERGLIPGDLLSELRGVLNP